MRNGRERLAWTVLVAGFFLCLALTVTVPVVAASAIRNATRPMALSLQSNQGTVVVDDANGSRPVRPGELVNNLGVAQTVLTNVNDAALIRAGIPVTDELLSRVQIYGNTNVTIEAAEVPRFAFSDRQPALALKIVNGRLRFSVPPREDQAAPLLLEVRTPQGVIDVAEPGDYAVEVNTTETLLSVQEGSTRVRSGEREMTVGAEQRVVLRAGEPPAGPLPAERDLLRNGDFADGLANWVLLSWDVERADQPAGSARPAAVSGEPAFYVRRDGLGHADVTLRQTVNTSVADFASLRLLVTMRINEQSLGVCGIQGSECPLTVRVEYVDANGANNTWQQGFFSEGEIVPDSTPDVCVFCAVVQRAHQRVPARQIVFYETDLLAELAQQGAMPPREIRSVSLIMAGHTFETEVIDVAMIGKE